MPTPHLEGPVLTPDSSCLVTQTLGPRTWFLPPAVGGLDSVHTEEDTFNKKTGSWEKVQMEYHHLKAWQLHVAGEVPLRNPAKASRHQFEKL